MSPGGHGERISEAQSWTERAAYAETATERTSQRATAGYENMASIVTRKGQKRRAHTMSVERSGTKKSGSCRCDTEVGQLAKKCGEP